MTAERPYARAVPPATGLNMLYKWRGTLFAPALVEQFMVIRDTAGVPLEPQKLLDLSREPKIRAGESYRIRRTLKYGKAGVNTDTLFLG